MKKISSNIFFYKRIFPIFWFGFLGIFVLITLFANPAGRSLPLAFFVMPIIMAVFGYVLMKKIVFDLADEVTDCGDFLVVRFADIQERIALSNIMNISYSVMMNPPRVT